MKVNYFAKFMVLGDLLRIDAKGQCFGSTTGTTL